MLRSKTIKKAALHILMLSPLYFKLSLLERKNLLDEFYRAYFEESLLLEE